MLLEQAFHALPEVLCGSRYPGQDYESGIVTALTMAILQELNGRNVPNPLSCIQGERLYEDVGFSSGAGSPRYLRADLVLNTGTLRVASKRLGEHYGWRHENWLEAKFFRSRKNVTNKTGPTASLLVDLLRLAVLVPEKAGSKSFRGRYLLHIYDRPPTDYISARRNKNANGPGGKRAWASVVHEPGAHTVKIENLAHEPPSFQAALGGMGGLTLDLSLTNIALGPRPIPGGVWHGAVYWCILTRIDSVKCVDGPSGFAIGVDRAVTETNDGDLGALRTRVALALGEVPDAEKTKPDDPALTPDSADPDDACASPSGDDVLPQDP